MTARFRLSSNNRQHYLMIDATTGPQDASPSDTSSSLVLSLVLSDDDLTHLRTAVQAPKTALLKAVATERQEYKDALAELKKQYSNLRQEHRVLSDRYQNLVGQNTKFMATASRPTFLLDASMSRELDRLRIELKTARAQREAARADALASKAAYDDLVSRWEKQ